MYEIYRGDNATLNVTARDSDGDLVDLTDVDLAFAVKDRKTGETVIAKSSDDAQEIYKNDPTNGEVQVYLVPSDTTDLNPGAYEFDLQLTLANGQVQTVLKDVLVIRGDISA